MDILIIKNKNKNFSIKLYPIFGANKIYPPLTVLTVIDR